MTAERSSEGGLRAQVRNLAERASADGNWHDQSQQTLHVQREATLYHQSNVFLKVEFHAARLAHSFGGVVLNTFYTFTATETHNTIIEEELPEHVKAQMIRTPVSSQAIDIGDDETVEVVLGSHNEEVYDDDDDGFEQDELEYRFERSVRYRLDGRVKLLDCTWRQKYTSIDEDGDEEELFSAQFTRLGDSQHEEVHTLSLSAWGDAQPKGKLFVRSSDIDPSLINVEARLDKSFLQEDIHFLETVRSMVTSNEIIQATKREDTASMLALLAFLRYEGTVADIQKLI